METLSLEIHTAAPKLHDRYSGTGNIELFIGKAFSVNPNHERCGRVHCQCKARS